MVSADTLTEMLNEYNEYDGYPPDEVDTYIYAAVQLVGYTARGETLVAADATFRSITGVLWENTHQIHIPPSPWVDDRLIKVKFSFTLKNTFDKDELGTEVNYHEGIEDVGREGWWYPVFGVQLDYKGAY